jgi:hypothetical protein
MRQVPLESSPSSPHPVIHTQSRKATYHHRTKPKRPTVERHNEVNATVYRCSVAVNKPETQDPAFTSRANDHRQYRQQHQPVSQYTKQHDTSTTLVSITCPTSITVNTVDVRIHSHHHATRRSVRQRGLEPVVSP